MVSMTKQSNIIEGEMNTIESASPSSAMVKETFSAWLSDGNAKKYAPAVYLSCMDKVSAYLIRRKISIDDLWQLTNFNLFKSIYDKAINDKLFRAMDKKTHTTFVQVGQVFLKFLKSKPTIHKAPAVALEAPSHPGPRLTIKEAIIRVLENELHGMTAEQIYNKIIAEELYSFGAQNPQNVVRVELERACEKTNYTVRASKNCFRFERNQKGDKVYFLLSATPTNDTAQPSFEVNEPTEPRKVKNEPLNIEIWSDSIRQNFQIWMESENYAPSTARNYCSAVNRTFNNFKSLAYAAISEANTLSAAVHKFVSLLNQDSEFITANSIAHNQLSAALAALMRFIDSDASINMGDVSSVRTVADSELDDIVDLDEGKKCLREILDTHFLTLYGYSNIGILWSAAQNSLSMFLNDNAINYADDLWCFLIRAFKNEFVFNSPHIWKNPPDYPQSSKGLIINLARQYGGVVTREQIDNFFSQIKLTSLHNSFVLDKEQLLFYDKAKFILTETVNPNADRCSLIANALNTLFSSENMSYIVLRDIKLKWFSSLPGLPNGLQWTPLLLQELLRIRHNIGYRVILPSLKGQALDTVGAAIVPRKSEIETFADVVYLFCFGEYKLPYKLPAEELRLKLREAGMIEGNELIYNMHKALKDYRFAFSDENRTVMILER